MNRFPRVGQHGVVVQSQSFGHCAAKTGDVTDVQACQGAEQPDELFAFRRFSQDVKTVFYLGVLQFAEIAVDMKNELSEILGPVVDREVPMQLRLLY